MNNTLSSDTHVVLRTPSWPFSKIKDLSEEELLKALDDSFFKEALWIASPILFDESLKWKSGLLNKKEESKVVFSLAKYYQRLCTRSTPFGLFAGCTTIPVGEHSKIQLNNVKQRFTRLDANFLYQLILSIDNDNSIRKYLRYKCNTSLYELQNEYRYHEFTLTNNTRNYNVVSVQKDEYLVKIVEATRRREIEFEQLVKLLEDNDVSKEEIEEYIHELINSQIITSNLEPTVLTDDLLSDIITQLTSIKSQGYLDNIIALLNDIKLDLQKLDSSEDNEIAKYYSIVNKLQMVSSNIDISKLFQIDLYNPATNTSAFSSIDINNIITTTNLLINFATQINTPLSQFVQKFVERYDQDEVPLSLLLDPDVGIGYPINTGNNLDTPLVDDFAVRINTTNEIVLNDIDKILLQILIDATKNNSYEIDLSNYININATQNNAKPDLQPSLTCIVNKTILGNEERIIYKFATGNSSMDYLGRFSHTDASIMEMVTRIANHEQSLLSDFIFADIVHLPEQARMANVLLRPALYPFQIPYLANPTNQEAAIDVSDIMVSIRSGKVLLRSKRLNKFIIPRLNNAHNYSFSKMSIYRFLCEVQNQSNVKHIAFNWGASGKLLKFNPRVILNNMVVSPAKWNMGYSDVESLMKLLKKNAGADELKTQINEWKTKYNMPSKVILSQDDNDLLVDFDNRISTLTFLDEIKGKQSFQIKEFLFESNDCNERVNQYVINLLNNNRSHRAPSIDIQETNKSLQKKYLPGSEILFIKIYSGSKLLEGLLLNELYDLFQDLQQKNIISKWFFIRYADPEAHLRLRVYPTADTNTLLLLSSINKMFSEKVNSDIIWKVVIDTYHREIDRYGYNNIEFSEDFFYHDSECISKILKATKESDDPENYRWLSALKNIDTLFSIAGYNSLQEKYNEVLPIRNSFFIEFGGTKELSDTLSKKYRANKHRIETTLYNQVYSDLILDQINELLTRRNDSIKVLADIHEFRKALPSYIHMTLNRLFISNQRKHELVIYDFLERYYKSAIAREKLNNSN